MAKKKKETKVEEPIVEETIEQPIEEVVEKEIVEEKIDESKFKSAGDDSVVKIDLSQPPPESKSEEVEEEPVEKEEVEMVEEPEAKEETVEEQVEDKPEEQVEEQPQLQEITEENVNEELPVEEEITKKSLPENLQKLVNFMEETGGDLQDYVDLNKDVSKMDDSEVLEEYYRATKSHLTPEERDFILEDTFGYDEETDDPRDIRKKKIALKEQVAEARAHLDGQKSKYYEEIKAGSKLTPEQQKAIEFFNRHSKESESKMKTSEAAKKIFTERTNKVFNKDFKGFDYQVGDKKYRFNVKDPQKVKDMQSDINNFVNKFANKDKSELVDMKGYHKSFFTAMNADAIAKHFYEQGKADAVKDRVANDKNINLNPRKTHSETNTGGVKFKVLGESSSDIKNRSFKIRKKS